jgi:hypothetical protein
MELAFAKGKDVMTVIEELVLATYNNLMGQYRLEDVSGSSIPVDKYSAVRPLHPCCGVQSSKHKQLICS